MTQSNRTYLSTKTYEHSVGLSAAFRQWRAKSHCHFLHGYALKVNFIFGANTLDDRNWVVDFGGLKEVKQWMQDTFDHKTLVAKDDPAMFMFEDLHKAGVIDLVVVDAVGCEKFAELIYNHVENWLQQQPEYLDRVWLELVQVEEHPGNSAIVRKA